MHVTFVLCNSTRTIPYREGLASIGAVLTHAGIDVSLIAVAKQTPGQRFVDLIEASCPDTQIVGFSVATVELAEAQRLAKSLRQRRPDILRVCGGAHPTLDPEGCAAVPEFDVICRGEGEYPMLELAEAWKARRDFSSIQNLWVKTGETIIKNDIRPLITDLDSLPPPKRDIPAFHLDGPVEMVHHVMASRGCPYGCTYCCNAAIRGVYPNSAKYLRFKSVNRVIVEIAALQRQEPNLRYVPFCDDLIMARRSFFEPFCKRYAEEIGLPTWFTGRWELLTDRNIELLKKVQCLGMKVGLETGNEQLRKKVLHRNQSNQLVLSRAQALRAAGVPFELFTMVGLPTETLPRALETIKLSARLRGRVHNQHGMYYPFPSTPLHDRIVAEGWLSEREPATYFVDTKLEMPQFPRSQILFAHRNYHRYRAYYLLAFGLPQPLSKWLEGFLDWQWTRNGLRADQTDRWERTVAKKEGIYFSTPERAALFLLRLPKRVRARLGVSEPIPTAPHDTTRASAGPLSRIRSRLRGFGSDG